MDDLDREIEEAARAARRRVWRGRLATIASTATFLVVGALGTIVMVELFPGATVSELDAQREARKARGEEPSAATIVDDYAADRRDQSSTRFKVAPVLALAFASAYFVRKRLTPRDQRLGSSCGMRQLAALPPLAYG